MRYEQYGRSAQMHVEEIQRLEALEDSLRARIKYWQDRYYEMQKVRDAAEDDRRAEFETRTRWVRKLQADLANKEESLRKLRDIVASGSYESGRTAGFNEAKIRMGVDLIEREAHEVAMAEMTRRLEDTYKDRIKGQATVIGKLQNERGEARAQCSELHRKLDEAHADNREKSAYWSKQVDDAKREISALSEELDEERGQRGTTRLNEANKRIEALEKSQRNSLSVVHRLTRWERALNMEVDSMKATTDPLPVAGALSDIAKCIRAILDGHEPTF